MSESKYRSVRTVAVVRPPQPSEQLDSLLSVTRVPRPPQENDASAVQRRESYTINCGGRSFQFPAVYGYQGDDLDSLCQREVEPLLQGSFRGESSACIAYGQTGAGKSYLCGTESKSPNPWKNSVGAYVSRRIWEIQKEKRLKDCSVEISMIEIYREGSTRETTLDLLGGYTRVPLQGYSEGSLHEVFSGGELLEKVITGSGLRNTDATNGNARSSRSHAILTICIQHTRLDASKRAQRVSGKLLLVDLAGAETASAAEANSTQQKQGSGINVGLSALQLVIREVATVGKTLHYRDSKLTHLLKPALGGEDGSQGCNATFLGCVSPYLADGKRTQNTLNYMQQAANIRNSVQADVKLVEAKREAALKKENEKLKAQLQTMAAELQAAAATASAREEAEEEEEEHEQETTMRAAPAVRAEDVMVLSVSEHQKLLARSDAAAALEVILQKDQERFSTLQTELDRAKARVLELEEAAAATTPLVGKRQPQQLAHPGQFSFQSTAAATSALSPAMAALSVSPILVAASRSTEDFLEESGLLSSRARPKSAQGGSDNYNETTAAAADIPFRSPKLDLDDICLSPEISHLASEQLEVLQKLVRIRLQKGDAPSSTPISAATAGSTLQAALRRRTAEVTALRFAVHSYNACLGSLTTELALAKESEKETARMLHQAAQEKVQYVELVAKHQQALDIAQYDVVTLDAEVKELKQKRSSSATPNISSSRIKGDGVGGGGSMLVPGSGGGGSGVGSSSVGLLNRLMGRSPMASPPVSSPFSEPQKSPASTSPPHFQSPPSNSKAAPTADDVESPLEEDAVNATVGQPSSSAGYGGGGISPFPLADIELDDFDSDYEETREEVAEGAPGEEDASIDLTMDSPPAVPHQPRTAVPAVPAASAVGGRGQQRSQEQQVNDLQKKMAGGIDVGAIGASRSGTISEEFVEKNQHWKPFQKHKSSSTRSGKK
ncbi:hypothetical protein Ndes2526B_g04857 [Nannochloris sp. 'desiccata']|nr:hypothetical protein KSW81_000440 [Chlorella desiccata (nom. nud.)]KAH7620925.1 putative Kinesin-like protein KIN-4C [Chlorella desiccata (nom. nud.)]